MKMKRATAVTVRVERGDAPVIIGKLSAELRRQGAPMIRLPAKQPSPGVFTAWLSSAHTADVGVLSVCFTDGQGGGLGSVIGVVVGADEFDRIDAEPDR